jgi:hypothetical protein
MPCKKPAVYVNGSARIEDDESGKLTVFLNSGNFRGDYELRTKPFDGCKSFKTRGRFLLGRYSEVFYEGDLFLEELAKIIFLW